MNTGNPAPSLRTPSPAKSARLAGLHYAHSDGAGIQRRRAGKGFVFVTASGRRIRDERVLRRIRSLVIPPAWENVWICSSASGHLQAVGRDARGRKQYRYHPNYRAFRERTKFTHMLAFAQALPALRKRVRKDLNLPGLPRDKVLAAVVRLLDATSIRIGNDEYAKANHSFGLTTLWNRHVQIDGPTLRFQFRGKSGQEHDIELKDHQLARIVKRCHDLPGHELFEYLDEEGKPAKVQSEDVNEYLRGITGEDFTAKDFRTWAGTTLSAMALEKLGDAASPAQAKKNVAEAIKFVSQRLGNRPPACRKYYVHPLVIDSYICGGLCQAMARRRGARASSHRHAELAVIQLLKLHERAA